MKASDLSRLAREKWESSGLTSSDAKKLKLAPVAPEGWRIVPALRIPYFDGEGKETGFYRERFLGDAATFPSKDGKTQKYAQPRGTLNEVYMPPLLPKKWSGVLKDPGASLLITEGELKAAKACGSGFATLGLGGVDVWRSRKNNVAFLEQLEAINWKGRAVCIVYDSDAATKPDVMRAQQQLAHALLCRGAKVRIARLPSAEGGAKQGLDDFLVAHGRHGASELKKVLADASEPEGVAELWAMNGEVVFVNDPPMVVRQDTGLALSPEQFTGASYANRKHIAGGKPVRTAKAWLEWGDRLQVERLSYQPGAERLRPGEFFNPWSGLAVVPKRGDIKPWSNLLDFLFTDSNGRVLQTERRWFEQWCAYPLQNLGAKLSTAVVLFGVEQGTGKSMVGELLAGIYGKNAARIGNAELTSSFNKWLENKQFILGEEITGNEQRAHADKLKALITQQVMRINTKYAPDYDAKVCANFLFTSNNSNAFFLSNQDRRFFVHEVISKPKESGFYRVIAKWRDTDGLSHLLEYLLGLDLSGFDAHAHAPMTAAKSEMIQAGKSDVGRWVDDLRGAPAEALRFFAVSVAAAGEQIAEHCDLFTPTQLLDAVTHARGGTRTTAAQLGVELKNAGFQQRTVRVRSGATPKLYIVRRLDKWRGSDAKALADHWDSFFNDAPAPVAGRF